MEYEIQPRLLDWWVYSREKGKEVVPSQSTKQQRYLYSKFGSAWVHKHHFDQIQKGKSDLTPKKKS